MSLNAFVTLLTTDAYLPGALVCIQSLLEAEGPNPSVPFETVCLVTPATVSVESIKALRRNFSLVVGVEELRSGSESNLALLGRQDLASTLTKLQLFRLIQFRKIIFLDADTLVLSPLSHLFSLEAAFSAAPDSGWPDCFNSGLFVCTPSSDTFDNLIQLASERGSWDGGDQGLLNDYFHDWNRLSFTYNVTPSAYYTYAPAYRRYGDGIKVVHFIGSDKPWHQAGQRQLPSSSTSSSSSSSSSSSKSVAKNEKAQHDYASLLDRWFGVYQRYFGTTNNNTTFTFPTLQAVWDVPSSSNSRAAYTPPSLESLKKQFQGVQDAHNIAMGGYRNKLDIGNQQLGMRSLEGHYVSMPLSSGRPDLLGARVFIPKAEQITSAMPEQSSTTIAEGRSPSPPHPSVQIVSPTPIKPEITIHASDSPTHEQGQEQQQNRTWSPQHVSWDPARSEPPKNDRPQMEAGFNYHSENVWDEPHSSSSSKSFFRPPVHYGSIPSVTHQNYSQVARASPDQSKLRPVFPWEESSSSAAGGSTSMHYGHYPNNRATRVFPPEQQREKLKLTPTRPAPPPPTGASNSPSGSRSHTPSNAQYHYDQQHNQSHQEHNHHHHQAHSGYDNQHHHNASHSNNAPSPVIADFANLSSAYGNAWDSVEGIRRYAKNLQGNGNGRNKASSSSSSNGKRYSPGLAGSGGQARSSASSTPSASYASSSTGSTTSSSGAHHAHAPSVSSSHSRSASVQAAGASGISNVSRMSAGSNTTTANNNNNANEHSRQRTSSSTGAGYDTGGEASSRDGDDEDEDDEEDGPLDRRAIKFRSTYKGAHNYTSPGSSAPASLHAQPSSSSYQQAPPQNGNRFQPTSRTSSSETITRQPASSYPGSGNTTDLPDTSSGAYKPQKVSRVFDPSTATDVIRKEGLEALHRFVRSMEAKGAAANEAKNANANGHQVPQ